MKTFKEFVNESHSVEKIFESKIGELYALAGEAKGNFIKFKKEAIKYLKSINKETNWEDKDSEEFLKNIFADCQQFPELMEGVEYKESYTNVVNLTEQLKKALGVLIDDLKKNEDIAPNTRAASTFVLQDVFDKFMEFRSLVGKTDRKSTRLNSSHRCISY